jgi:hypothetical protein
MVTRPNLIGMTVPGGLRRSHNPESTFVSSALDFYRKALVVSATEEFPKRESIPLRFEL